MSEESKKQEKIENRDFSNITTCCANYPEKCHICTREKVWNCPRFSYKEGDKEGKVKSCRPLEVALAEIQLVIKDLCGLVADLYHQHEEIVTEKNVEIQKLQEKADNFDTLTERFNFVNKDGLFSLNEFANAVLKGTMNWNEKVVQLAGVVAEVRKILNELDEISELERSIFYVVDGKESTKEKIVYKKVRAFDARFVELAISRLRVVLKQAESEK